MQLYNHKACNGILSGIDEQKTGPLELILDLRSPYLQRLGLFVFAHVLSHGPYQWVLSIVDIRLSSNALKLPTFLV